MRRGQLLVGISMHTAGDGVSAVVELSGDVCPATAPRVADALEKVAAEGATEVCVDLSGVDLCTSHGFDVLDRFHHALLATGGRLEVRGAKGGVARCLETLRDLDPTFLPTSG